MFAKRILISFPFKIFLSLLDFSIIRAETKSGEKNPIKYTITRKIDVNKFIVPEASVIIMPRTGPIHGAVATAVTMPSENIVARFAG